MGLFRVFISNLYFGANGKEPLGTRDFEAKHREGAQGSEGFRVRGIMMRCGVLLTVVVGSPVSITALPFSQFIGPQDPPPVRGSTVYLEDVTTLCKDHVHEPARGHIVVTRGVDPPFSCSPVNQYLGALMKGHKSGL